MPSSCCFVPGCKTGYRTQRIKLKLLNKNMPSLFQLTKQVIAEDDMMLEKWIKAIQRADRTFSYQDKVCELHFAEDDIERYFRHNLADGTVHNILRERPLLKPGAIPKIFPNLPECFTKHDKKRKAPFQRDITQKKRKDDDLLQKWNTAILRADRPLTYKDGVCELHFKDYDIIQYDTFYFPDGTFQNLDRKKPVLKHGAIPTIFPNLPERFSKLKGKRKSPMKHSSPKKKRKILRDVDQFESQVPEKPSKQLKIDVKSLPRSIFSDKNPKSTDLHSLRQDLELTYKGSEFETEIFLLNYLQHPCLWNKKHPNYNVVEERRFAENCLLECCELSSLQMLLEKINHIHTEYNEELCRMKKMVSQSSDKFFYLPKLQWFEFVHELLENSPEELSLSPIEIEENSSSENVDDSVSAGVDESIDVDKSIKAYKSTSKQKTVMTQTDFEAFKIPSFVVGQEISDEFAMFGQHVASQLNKLSFNKATALQESIQKLILEARLCETESNPSPGKEELESILDNYNAYLLFNKLRKSICDDRK